MKKLFFFSCFCSVALFSQEIQPEDVQPLQAPSVEDYYAYMQEALDDEDWWAAIDFGELVLYHFPECLFRQEIPYYIGLAYFQLNQHELANQALSDYLKNSATPKHFEEAMKMKFEIAEFFHKGGKKRLFGSHKLPAILSGEEDALQIYEEVITTLPHHEMAVRALLHKADLQVEFRDFKPSVESLQVLIRRFPKHELTPEAYLQINKVYLKQCQDQHLDPDLLDLAAVNLRKFRLAFPREPRIADAELAYAQMEELFAKNLMDTAAFFKKRKKNEAALIYYSKVAKQYPKTNSAILAREHLEQIKNRSSDASSDSLSE